MKFPCLGFGGVCLLVLGTAGAAQELRPPVRPLRGFLGGAPAPDPSRERQELTLSGSFLGGFDDNLTTPGEGDVFEPRPSGFVGLADARVRYWHGDLERSLELGGRGYTNSFQNIGLGPSFGGEQILTARTDWGRRQSIEVSQSLRYDPFFSLGGFGALPVEPGSSTPDSNPTNGLTEQRSWIGNISTSFRRQWSRDTSSDFGYGYGWTTYADGPGYDSRNHALSATVNHSLSRSFALVSSYRVSDSNFSPLDGIPVPLRDHTLDGGVEYTRNLSRTRRLSLSAGGGTTYVDSVDTVAGAPYDYWAPAAYGNARVDFGRTWTFNADYRRDVAVLHGLNPEIFVSQVGLVSVGGYLNNRLEGVVSTGYSKGQTGAGVGQQYDTFAANAQLRVWLFRGWSSVVSFNHYQYFLDDASSVSLGVSPQLYRNAVRVGLSWSAPILGSYIDEPDPLSDGNGRR